MLLYISAIILTLVGVIMRRIHSGYDETFVIVGLISSLGYMSVGIYEVHTSKNFDSGEKIMWTVGFIFFSTITGLVYSISGRKKAFLKSVSFAVPNEKS